MDSDDADPTDQIREMIQSKILEKNLTQVVLGIDAMSHTLDPM